MDVLRNIVLGMLLASWCLSGSSALADKRVALVIGNSSYDKVAHLGNAANDAELMARTFKAAGFDSVDLRRDLNVNDMRRALRDFVDRTSDADVAVVYYAGHGIEIDGVNFLIPVDAVLNRDRDIHDEGVSLERVLVSVEPAKKLRLIILDACRDNPFAGKMKRTLVSRAIGRGLAKVEPTSPNTLIAFASKAGSTASDGEGRSSPYTTALVAHLTRPGLDLRKAFGYVRDDVLKSTGNRQEPYLYGSLGGDDIPLVPAAPGTSILQADPQDAVRRDYELALQLGSRDVWEAFLRTYPDGFYADLAKAQLKKIATEEARVAAGEKARLTEQEKPKPAGQENAPGAIAEKADSNKVASLQPSAAAALTQSELTTLLQLELRRVGCLSSPAKGEWTAASERSLNLFSQHSGLKFDAKAASVHALEAVKASTGRVCPLMCDHGFRAQGDRCVRLACGRGSFVNDDNECEKKQAAPRKPEARQVPRSREPTPPPTVAGGMQSGSGRANGCNSAGLVMSGKC